MKDTAAAAIEATRMLWTPEREAEEISADLEPQTELDAQIRTILHALVQQGGRAVTVDMDEVNKGSLRWELVSVPLPGGKASRVLNVWVEE